MDRVSRHPIPKGPLLAEVVDRPGVGVVNGRNRFDHPRVDMTAVRPTANDPHTHTPRFAGAFSFQLGQTHNAKFEPKTPFTGGVMADNPDTHPAKEATMIVSDTPHAPFVYYEGAPAFGFTNGVLNITLSAHRTLLGPDGVINEQVVVAYLRGNVQAALSLRQAIDNALLLAAPTGAGKAN